MANRSTRRSFLQSAAAAGTATAAAVFTIVRPSAVRGAEANSKIELGIVGQGGRGRWIADLFAQHGGYKITALADYFPQVAASAAEQAGPGPKPATPAAGKSLKELQADFLKLKFGMFLHYNMATYTGEQWVTGEACFSLAGHKWFWDSTIRGYGSAQDVLGKLQTANSRHSNLLLNVPHFTLTRVKYEKEPKNYV